MTPTEIHELAFKLACWKRRRVWQRVADELNETNRQMLAGLEAIKEVMEELSAAGAYIDPVKLAKAHHRYLPKPLYARTPPPPMKERRRVMRRR
jgi:hypothetical protein